MKQAIGYVALLVKDYDEAIKFYVDTLGFCLIEDKFIEAKNKRWVVVAPPGSTESKLLLARAEGAEQSSQIGNQTDGRVFLFLHTDDFWRDFNLYKSKGVVFVREPTKNTTARSPYSRISTATCGTCCNSSDRAGIANSPAAS